MAMVSATNSSSPSNPIPASRPDPPNGRFSEARYVEIGPNGSAPGGEKILSIGRGIFAHLSIVMNFQ